MGASQNSSLFMQKRAAQVGTRQNSSLHAKRAAQVGTSQNSALFMQKELLRWALYSQNSFLFMQKELLRWALVRTAIFSCKRAAQVGTSQNSALFMQKRAAQVGFKPTTYSTQMLYELNYRGSRRQHDIRTSKGVLQRPLSEVRRSIDWKIF